MQRHRHVPGVLLVFSIQALFLSSMATGQEGAALGPLDWEAPRSVALPETPGQDDPVPTDELMTVPLPPGLPVDAPAGPPVSVPSETSAIPMLLEDTPRVQSRWSAVSLPEEGQSDAGGGLVPSGEGAGEAVQVGASLAGVLALIWVLRHLLRRARGDHAGARILGAAGAPSGVASVLARYPMSRGHQVLLLEFGRRVVVIHQSESAMNTLSEITDPEELADLKARLSGVERIERDRAFNAKLSTSLETTPGPDSLESVSGMPGMVAETVDLTVRSGRSRGLVGGGA